MIQKFYILQTEKNNFKYENKLITCNFSINKKDNNIIIKPYIDKEIIKVPIYNKYNGLIYYPIYFPLILPIFNNKIFNPYVILSSSNFNNDNAIDFFYNLFKTIKIKFNLELFIFNDLFNKEYNLTHNINNYYNDNITMKNIINNNIPNIIWLNINIILLNILYKLSKRPDNLQNNKTLQKISQYKYLLLPNTFIRKTFTEYYNIKNKLELVDLKPNESYFILCKSNSVISKINITSINKNIIISNNTEYIFEEYDWSIFNLNIQLDKSDIIYYTFINKDFVSNIINQLFNINSEYKIYDYFMNYNNYDNLLVLPVQQYFNETNIISSNNYSVEYFKLIVDKYNTSNEYKNNKLINILYLLFKNYKYPLKINKHELDDVFDNIIYLCLNNMTNGSNIIFENIDVNTVTSENIIYNLNSKINEIIPGKLKNLFINLLKTLLKLINDNYESIVYNQRFYNDTLYKNILKIFIDSSSNQLSVKLFHSLINPDKLNRIKEIITINSLLINISNRLNWNNINKKLNYINYFYLNQDILYYQNKLNKNIISPTLDYKIVKIIENPFEMYKYLKKEKDFIKWSSIIYYKINDMYEIPVQNIDYNKFGKMIYLLYNIKEQNLKDESYIKFINFCNENEELIITPNNKNIRINIKLKDTIQLKTNINLGYLARHLLLQKTNIIFDTISDEQIIIDRLNKKYNKYKNRYIKYKYNKDNIDNIDNIDDEGSDTSD